MFAKHSRLLDLECRQAGVVALEFALIAPIMLMIVFGIIEFGAAFYDKNVLTNASREGARAGIVLRSPRLDDASIKKIVESYSSGYLITFSGSPTVNTTVTHGTDEKNGNAPKLTVRVEYEFGGLVITPIMRPFTGPINLAAVSSMDYE